MKKSCIFIAFGGTWSKNSSVASQFKALADALVEKGITVISLIQGRPDPKLSGDPNTYYWPSTRPTKIKDSLFFIKLLRKYKPRCIITQLAATNIMLLTSCIFGVPLRLTWSHTISEAIKYDWSSSKLKLNYLIERKRLVYKCATHIIHVSKFEQADFKNTFHISNKVHHIFYNGKKDLALNTPAAEDKKKIVICIGRLDYSKGQDIIIKAFRQVVNRIPDALLILVGEGKFRPSYMSLVSDLKLENSVKFYGRVSPDEVINLLTESKVSVLPSRMDNCPLAIIESLSTGVPVIASRVGGIPEILIDGVTGYLIESEDNESFSSQIIKVLEDPDLQMMLSKNAKTDFLARFEITRVIEEQVEWLENIGAF